jgi:hypothetical protein
MAPSDTDLAGMNMMFLWMALAVMPPEAIQVLS